MGYQAIIFLPYYYSITSKYRTNTIEDSSMTEDGFKEPEKEQEKPGPGVPEKKTLIVEGIAIAILILAVIALVVIAQSPAGNGTAQPLVIKNFTPSEKGVSSAQTHNVQKTIRQTGTQTIIQTPTIQKTTALPVDFVLQPGDPANCGLTCRQLDATITNTGYATAHNVCINVGLHNSRNEIINLNGEPSINRCIGDISGGQKKTEPITINADCGVFATKCIGETLTLQTRVTSTEKIVQFPDQLIAV